MNEAGIFHWTGVPFAEGSTLERIRPGQKEEGPKPVEKVEADQVLSKKDVRELAEMFNQLLKESEPVREPEKPLIERATTLAEFYDICEKVGGNVIEVNGTPMTGEQLKEIAQDVEVFLRERKIISAFKAIQRIPAGPLRSNLSKLEDPEGLLELWESEVDTAYKQ